MSFAHVSGVQIRIFNIDIVVSANHAVAEAGGVGNSGRLTLDIIP